MAWLVESVSSYDFDEVRILRNGALGITSSAPLSAVFTGDNTGVVHTYPALTIKAGNDTLNFLLPCSVFVYSTATVQLPTITTVQGTTLYIRGGLYASTLSVWRDAILDLGSAGYTASHTPGVYEFNTLALKETATLNIVCPTPLN